MLIHAQILGKQTFFESLLDGEQDVYALGIDFSKEACTMVVLDLESGGVIYQGNFDYDTSFPRYNTINGILPSTDETVSHTSPLMMLEALDRTFTTMKADGVELSRIGVVKISGMPHCTVYTGAGFSSQLGSLDSNSDLLTQLAPHLTRQTSPTFEDNSAAAQAAFLASSLAEWGGISYITGNDAERCFPASQVLKWAVEAGEDYERTTGILIQSAFLTSILTSDEAPIDTADGWGTNWNNVDIKSPDWSQDVLYVIHDYLKKKNIRGDFKKRIGKMTHFDVPVGRLNRYFVDKYRMNEKTAVLVGTSRDAAELLGSGGQMVIHLDENYTVKGAMEAVTPSALGEYRTFGYTRGQTMAVATFNNGGRVHKRFIRRYLMRDRFGKPSGIDWKHYVKFAGRPVLDYEEKLMLPYVVAEKLPYRKKGVVRAGFGIDDAKSNVRSLHISQVISFALHSRHLREARKISVVGGGVRNSFLLQLIADVFNAECTVLTQPELIPALGCALSGAGFLLDVPYDAILDTFASPHHQSLTYRPNPENTSLIPTLLERYEKLEAGPSSWL